MYWLSSSLYFFFQQMRRKQLTFIISLSYILNCWRSLWLKHGNPLITTSNQQNGINIKFLYFYTCNIKTIISWYIAKGNQNCIDRRYATNVTYFGQNWLILKIFLCSLQLRIYLWRLCPYISAIHSRYLTIPVGIHQEDAAPTQRVYVI